MLDITIENALTILKKYLEGSNQKKFEHSIRVAKTSKILAKKWNVSTEDAIIAALLHDIGKAFSRRELLALCARNGIELYDFEIFDNLTALHGKVSSLLFEKEFNKNDKEKFEAISNAISSHVAGNEHMNDLEKVLFIADNIEPDKGNDILLQIQSGKIKDPNECIKRIIKEKIEKSNKKGQELNPMLHATLASIEEER